MMCARFQSPQWGKRSKGYGAMMLSLEFQSPQWGDCSKVERITLVVKEIGFQSP